MTIGKLLVEVAKGNKVILDEAEETVRSHKEVGLLRVCLNAAKKGAFEVELGRCLPPPYMDEEDIFFRHDANGNMFAYWK